MAFYKDQFYVCMDIYIYNICIYMHCHMSVYIYMYVCMYVCMYECMYVHTSGSTCAPRRVVCICVCMFVTYFFFGLRLEWVMTENISCCMMYGRTEGDF
jgi:hypothetical protein